MNYQFGSYELQGLETINVILGKNGCGKSTLLRTIDQQGLPGLVKYITPERGGELIRDGSVETNRNNKTWVKQVRQRNRFEQFKNMSYGEFQKLEILVLRQIEADSSKRSDPAFTFDVTLRRLNNLLENVRLCRSSDGGFTVKAKASEEDRTPAMLSSGEGELISLGIEILGFGAETQTDNYNSTENWLLFDEPDVHLHPDLQQRLMQLLVEASREGRFRTIICTHSSAIVSALSDLADPRIALMQSGEKSLKFEEATETIKAILPIFGSHPLSNVFNDKRILLLEGDDDERIWQQAYRTSKGRLRIWPCVAGDVQSLNTYEQMTDRIVAAVYDRGQGYSLRDRDNDPHDLEDLPNVMRFRLNCRAAENLIVSDDVLAVLGTTWSDLQRALTAWLARSSGHRHFAELDRFRRDGWDRRNACLKAVRNILVAESGSSKPWEVAVGQAIAALPQTEHAGATSLTDFLGEKIVRCMALK